MRPNVGADGLQPAAGHTESFQIVQSSAVYLQLSSFMYKTERLSSVETDDCQSQAGDI